MDTPLTVNLQVRVVEVQRTVTRQLGINWGAALSHFGGFVTGLSVVDRVVEATNLPDQFNIGYNGTQGGVKAVIDALAQDQLAVILAEPNLTAQSGETASFLAGGEYPIPIAQQNNTISIDYKQVPAYRWPSCRRCSRPTASASKCAPRSASCRRRGRWRSPTAT